MSTITSLSSTFLEKSKTFLTIKEDDSLSQKTGKFLSNAIIYTAITTVALFEAIICAASTVAVSPAFLIPSTRYLCILFGAHTLAAINTIMESARAIFIPVHQETKKIKQKASKENIITSRKIETIAKNVLSKSSTSLKVQHYLLISLALVGGFLLGYYTYSCLNTLVRCPLPPVKESIEIFSTSYSNACNTSIEVEGYLPCLREKTINFIKQNFGNLVSVSSFEKCNHPQFGSSTIQTCLYEYTKRYFIESFGDLVSMKSCVAIDKQLLCYLE